jgi:hypothetical protein
MTSTATRRAILAMAGLSTGIVGTVVAPASAHAAVTTEQLPQGTLADLKAQVRTAGSGALAAAELPTCTHHRDFVSGNWLAHVPSTAGGNTNCELENGDFNLAGVKVLQDGLNCNGESLTTDGDYGDRTTAAVKRLQDKEGLPATGEYTVAVFTNAPSWALYNTITDARVCP